MILKKLLGVPSALCLCVPLCGIALAQETNKPADFDQRLKQMQEMFEQRERAMEARFEKKIAAQDAEIDALKRQIAGRLANPPPSVAAASTNRSEVPDLIKELSDKVDGVVEAQKKTMPGVFNPAIGFVGDFLSSYHSKGSDKTGSDRPGGFDFWARSLEMAVSASVDPFAKGWVVANASADSAGESTFGIEEAALQTTSLPGNLTLTAGRFFGEFGRLSYIHDHELPFVNRPLVLDNYIGGESRSDGAQLNWLVPVDHYISLTAGVGDQFGGDSPNPNNPGNTRVIGGLNFWGRASTSFDLTDNWSAEAGVSGLWNPKTEDRGGVNAYTSSGGIPMTERERRLAGLDFKLSYVPLRDNQFRSFTWGTEVLFSDNDFLFDPDGIPANSDEYRGDVSSLGMYSYMNYKWSRQWSAGFLFDYIQSAQNHDDETFAYSPFVTFAWSHWNQLRLQYTHTDRSAVSGLKPDDAIYLQWSWIIGSHSHGWTQR